MTDKKYCIIVPVFENKENLVKFIKIAEDLINENQNVDMIFVNDGNNYSLEELININKVNFKIINNNKNIGYGASIKKAVSSTNHEVIGIIDCDNSYDLKQLIDLIKEFENSNCDLLVGKRIFKYQDSYFKILFRKERIPVPKLQNQVLKRNESLNPLNPLMFVIRMCRDTHPLLSPNAHTLFSSSIFHHSPLF